MQKDYSVFTISQSIGENLGQFQNTSSCIYNMKLIMQTFCNYEEILAYFRIYQTSNIASFFAHRAALFRQGVLLLLNVLFTLFLLFPLWNQIIGVVEFL